MTPSKVQILFTRKNSAGNDEIRCLHCFRWIEVLHGICPYCYKAAEAYLDNEFIDRWAEARGIAVSPSPMKSIGFATESGPVDHPQKAFWRQKFLKHLELMEGILHEAALLRDFGIGDWVTENAVVLVLELFPLKEEHGAFYRKKILGNSDRLTDLKNMTSLSLSNTHSRLAQFILQRETSIDPRRIISELEQFQILRQQRFSESEISLNRIHREADFEILIGLFHWRLNLPEQHKEPLLKKNVLLDRLQLILESWQPESSRWKAWRALGLVYCDKKNHERVQSTLDVIPSGEDIDFDLSKAVICGTWDESQFRESFLEEIRYARLSALIKDSAILAKLVLHDRSDYLCAAAFAADLSGHLDLFERILERLKTLSRSEAKTLLEHFIKTGTDEMAGRLLYWIYRFEDAESLKQFVENRPIFFGSFLQANPVFDSEEKILIFLDSRKIHDPAGFQQFCETILSQPGSDGIQIAALRALGRMRLISTRACQTIFQLLASEQTQKSKEFLDEAMVYFRMSWKKGVSLNSGSADFFPSMDRFIEDLLRILRNRDLMANSRMGEWLAELISQAEEPHSSIDACSSHLQKEVGDVFFELAKNQSVNRRLRLQILRTFLNKPSWGDLLRQHREEIEEYAKIEDDGDLLNYWIYLKRDRL